MSIAVAVLLFLLLFLVFISMILLVVGPVMLLHPHRRLVEYYRRRTSILHPSDLRLPYEEITLRTAEGLPLSCWFVRAPGRPRGTVVVLHGVSECKIVGLPLAKRLHDRGYHVFLYDARRHGDSGGSFCTYGFYEKHDVSTVITHLERRPDVETGRIGVMGASMGAAVAVQVAAVDPRVAAVVAESGFATLRSVFDEYQKRMIKIPFHFLRNLVIRRSERMAHFKASAVSPLEAVRSVHVPVFFLHGTEDTLIRHTASELLYRNANDPKELWLIRGARHDNMPDIGGEEYYERILGFFDRTIAGPGPTRGSSPNPS